MNMFACFWLFCTVLTIQCKGYVLIAGDYTWIDAENNCLTQYGSHLATITDSGENTAFYTLCPNVGDGCWMGYNKINSINFEWVDGSDSSYTNWRIGEPSGDGDCVENHQDVDITLWNDRSCSLATCDAICNNPYSVSCEIYGYIEHVNWDNITSSIFDKSQFKITKFESNTDDLTLNIELNLPYLGYSFANDGQYGYGTTYVIDFAPFDGNNDKIYQPGNCQNRKQESFYTNSTLKNFSVWWEYSKYPYIHNELGLTDQNIAYTSSDYWSILSNFESYTDIEQGCNSIKYFASFSWSDLLGCTSYDGNTPYLSIDSDNNFINISGTLYVDIVSPYSLNEDYGGYRKYGIITQAFEFSINRNNYGLASIGVNIYTMSVLSIGYSQNNNKQISVTLLTESSDQLYLYSGQILLYPFNNGIYDINVSSILYPLMSNCLTDKQYICRQKWLLYMNNIECNVINGNDFSGEYSILFNAQCNTENVNNTQCNQYINTYGNTVALTVNVSYSDNDCTSNNNNFANLDSTINIYKDSNFSINSIDSNYAFYAGTDIVYVEIRLDEEQSILNSFEISLENVWICTYNPDDGDISDPTTNGDGGCLSNDINIESYYHIYVNGQAQTLYNTQEINIINDDIIRFSFIIPNDVTRNILFIHTQIIVTFSDDNNIRRRVLTQNHLNQYSYIGDEIIVILPIEKSNDDNSNDRDNINDNSLLIISSVLGSIIFLLIVLMIIILLYVLQKNKHDNKCDAVNTSVGINTSAQ